MIARVISFLWQLPQNLLGLLFLLFIRGEEKHYLNGIAFYYSKRFRGGISLGRYIILGDKLEHSIKHEYGHCLQSKMLGPLYLIVVGLPSIIWAMLYGWLIQETKNGYYRFYTEKWANRLGGVVL